MAVAQVVKLLLFYTGWGSGCLLRLQRLVKWLLLLHRLVKGSFHVVDW